jgi:uncharacterized membrane protein
MQNENLSLEALKLSATPASYSESRTEHPIEKSRHAVTINRTPQEVYSFWRDFKNLPLFMKDLAQVQEHSEILSRWTVKLKYGALIEWETQITRVEPGVMISWQSLPGSDVTTAGSVWFTPTNSGCDCVVNLSMDYIVPGGILTEGTTFLLGESPDLLAQINLKRLKAYLETGEVPTTEGQSSGREEDQTSIEITHEEML